MFTGEFHGHGGDPRCSVLKFVELVNLVIVEAGSIDLDAVVNTTTYMHFVQDIESSPAQLSNIIEHR